jgi:hypothetical protein
LRSHLDVDGGVGVFGIGWWGVMLWRLLVLGVMMVNLGTIFDLIYTRRSVDKLESQS